MRFSKQRSDLTESYPATKKGHEPWKPRRTRQEHQEQCNPWMCLHVLQTILIRQLTGERYLFTSASASACDSRLEELIRLICTLEALRSLQLSISLFFCRHRRYFQQQYRHHFRLFARWNCRCRTQRSFWVYSTF